MRKTMKTLAAAGSIGVMLTALAPPAHADSLESHWNEARERWNSVGDAAADGDASALAELQETVSACLLDAACAPANQDAPDTVERPLTWDHVHAASAAANLGWLYGGGRIGPEDDVQAWRYFRLAAALGHPPAMQSTGSRYRLGDGVPVDTGKALEYFEAAYRAGSVSGALNYAEMVKDGDPATAFEVLSRAVRMAPTDEQMERINEMHAEVAPAARAAMSGADAADSAPPPRPPQPAVEIEAGPDDLSREQTRECARVSVELARWNDMLADSASDLQDWNRQLEQWLQRLNDQYADAITDGQYNAARRNERRYLDENDEFNSAAEAYNRERAQFGSENDDFEDACLGTSVIASWGQAACETYSYGSAWCRRFRN